MNNLANSRSFRIGDWLVVPDLNRIERDGELVDLQPRLMAVLEELARLPGQVVTRDDLHRSIWRDVAVTDDALNRCITQLRRALGDNPREPRFIETISKKGYRLVADVCRSQKPPAPADADLVIVRPRLLGYEAHVNAQSMHTGMIVVNGMLLIVERTAENEFSVRTRSYWAAAPFWLAQLCFVISFLLLYGHAFNVGTVAAWVLISTAGGAIAGVTIRTRVLADARGALRTLTRQPIPRRSTTSLSPEATGR